MQPRRTDLDALRILVCAGVILAHAALLFAEEPRYHLKSELPSLSASIVYEFMRITTMPLFFILAGWSAVTSLRKRPAVRFAVERARRLLVPLIFGVIVFCSVIKYIELSHGRDIGAYGLRMVPPLQIGFPEFFALYLTRSRLLTWSHLWFLAYLFIISLVFLPLLTPLARRAPRTDVPAAVIVYLPGLVLAAWLVAFNGYWPFLPSLYKDGANFSYFALCFALGTGIAAWPGCERRLQPEALRLLLLMLVAFAGVILCGESTLGRAFVGLTAWGAVGTALGLSARLKPTASPTLRYLNEAAMPVYVVHHVPLLLLGTIALPLTLPVWLTIVPLALLTTVISIAAYHWLIRPWRPMRVLMGVT